MLLCQSRPAYTTPRCSTLSQPQRKPASKLKVENYPDSFLLVIRSASLTLCMYMILLQGETVKVRGALRESKAKLFGRGPL